MPHSSVLTPAPTDVCRSLAAIEALGHLFLCTDPEAWATRARPDPHGLAALVFAAHVELATSLHEVLAFPEDGAHEQQAA